MDFSRVAALTAGIGISISTANVAQAAFVMTLDDLSTTGVDVILSDGLGVGATTGSSLVTTAADGIAPDGFISFNGGVGSFTVNVVTGVSDPLIGPGELDLNSINVSGSDGILEVRLTDTGYTGNVSAYTANFGGTTTGNVDFNFLRDAGNDEFGGSSFFDPAAASGGAFSGSGGGSTGAGSGPYSLTILAQINHIGSGQISSFDAHLVPVPIPGAVWLLGSGLLGLAGIARRHS